MFPLLAYSFSVFLEMTPSPDKALFLIREEKAEQTN